MITIANAQWQHTSLDSNFIQSIITKGDTIFAGSLKNGVFRSLNNGGSWTMVNTGLPGTVVVYAFAIKDSTVFTGGYGGVYKSTDYGDNWTPAYTGMTNNGIWSMALRGNDIIAGTYGGGLYLSSNNGNNWDSINNGIANRCIMAINTKGDSIFAGTYGNVGSIFFSPNNGVNWDSVNNGMPPLIWIDAIARKGDTTFAGDRSCMGVFRTTNYGQSWTAVNTGLTIDAEYVNSLTLKDNYLFAGTGDGVFITTNNGNNWVAKNNGLPSYHIVRTIAINNKFIFAGLDSFGVWRLPLSELSAGFEEMNNHERNIAVYPNPATNHINIETSSEGIITISTIQGQLIKTTATSGSKTNVDVSALPCGVYIVEVRTEKGIGVKKFIKE